MVGVDGFVGANANFTITSKQFEGKLGAPALQPIAGNYINPQGQEVDFDGSFNLQWTPAGGELGYEIEQATADGSDWQTIATVSGGSTTYALNNLANGQYSFRVRGILPGQIGKYITNPSNAAGIVVDQRSKVDITNMVSQAISNVSLSGGVFQLNLALTNNSAQTYLPLVDLNVIGITSTSGTVKVINGDSGGDGRSPATAALFGYTSQLGSDQLFSPSEVSGTRNLRFQDNASEMFNFDAVVTAYLGSGGSSSSPSSASQQQSSAPNNSGPSLPLNQLKAVMRFTANPLTKTVTVQLVSLK